MLPSFWEQPFADFAKTHPRVIAGAILILGVLLLIVVRQWTTPQASQILLPAGGTYLGPK